MVNHYYCTLVTYVISYSYYTSIKKKKMMGEGRGLPEKHQSVGTTSGKVFKCPFGFVKQENLERLKEYILYVGFYK